MPHRHLGTIALHFLVAITSLASTAGREWRCVHEDKATPRIAAQRADVDGTASALVPDDLLDTPPHDFGCPCCQRPNPRMTVAPSPTRASSQPSTAAPIVLDARPILRQHRARPTDRGPPSR